MSSLGSVAPILQPVGAAELMANSVIQRIPQATAHRSAAETVGGLMDSALESEHVRAEETPRISFLDCFQEWDFHADWVVDKAFGLRDWRPYTEMAPPGPEYRLAGPQTETADDQVGLPREHRKWGFRMERVLAESRRYVAEAAGGTDQAPEEGLVGVVVEVAVVPAQRDVVGN